MVAGRSIPSSTTASITFSQSWCATTGNVMPYCTPVSTGEHVSCGTASRLRRSCPSMSRSTPIGQSGKRAESSTQSRQDARGAKKRIRFLAAWRAWRLCVHLRISRLKLTRLLRRNRPDREDAGVASERRGTSAQRPPALLEELLVLLFVDRLGKHRSLHEREGSVPMGEHLRQDALGFRSGDLAV